MTTTPADEMMIDIGSGVYLEVGQAGEGDPLVLVCGTCQDFRLWSPLMPMLTTAYRVTGYNHRGIGKSSRGIGPISAASLAADLDGLLAALNIERAHVLGWSLGSVVAQELAVANPDRVASVVLASTWGRTDTYQVALATALSHPWRTGDRRAGITALLTCFSAELLDSGEFAQFFAPFEPLFPGTAEQLATAAEQWDAVIAHNAVDRLSAVAAPALVVAGDEDVLVPARLGRTVADLIPGALYELLRGAGSSHAMLFERPEEFASSVLEFLSRHPLTVPCAPPSLSDDA